MGCRTQHSTTVGDLLSTMLRHGSALMSRVTTRFKSEYLGNSVLPCCSSVTVTA